MLYAVYATTTNELKFISRRSGSSVFSTPVVIKQVSGRSSVSSAYSLRRTSAIIHTFFHNNGKIFYTESRDNGATWSAEEDLKLQTTSNSEHLLAVSNPNITDGIFLFYAGSETATSMVYSVDHADTFSTPHGLTGKVANVTAVLCGTKEAKILATVADAGHYINWQNWSERKIDQVVVDTPFDPTGRRVSCDWSATAKFVMLGKKEKSRLESFITHHEVLKTPS